MMLSQAIERPIIVASLSGRTLESLTIDNLIWPSVLDYLGIKEDIMDIPGKISVSINNQCQNMILCCIFYIFLILVNVAIWYLDLVTGIFRMIITMICLCLMILTFIKCGCFPCLENQDDIKGQLIAEFDEKCKFCHYITVIIS